MMPLAESKPILDQILLGIVQGLTEFLPVSSSGHLVALERWQGMAGADSMVSEILLHFATLLSVVIVFHKDILALLRGVFAPGPGRSQLIYIFVACIPAGIVGLLFKDQMEQLTGDWPLAVPLGWLVTAALLFSIKKREKQTDGEAITLRTALIIGVIQAFALLPGISRSGSTIVAALWLHVRRDRAASFSFLLSVPIIAGATLKTLLDLRDQGSSIPDGILWGGVAAFITGIVALRLLLTMIERGALHWWGYYLVGVALLYGGWVVTAGSA